MTVPSPSAAAAAATQVEALLFEVARDLLRLPFEGRTRNLHLRALKLKRLVSRWTQAAPSARERETMQERVLELHRETLAWRQLLGAGQGLRRHAAA
jgi:hypothetical protein